MKDIPMERSEIEVLFLCGKTREDFFKHFKNWSGGLEPNESDQIYTYLETAISMSMFNAIEHIYEKNNDSTIDNSHWNYLNYMYG